MLKKSLLSLAVTASLVGLSGCNISSTTDSAGSVPQIQQDQQAALAAYGTYAVFDAANSKLPLGIDLIFADAGDTDGTANVGATGGNPVYEAINDLDGGISTLAPIDFAMSGSIDKDTATAMSTVWLVRLPNAADVAALTFPDVGGGYNIGTADVPVILSASNYDALDVTHAGALLTSALYTNQADYGAAATVFATTQPAAGSYEVSVLSLDGGTGNTIRISPTTPLSGKTKYIAVVTDGVKTTAAVAIKPSQDYATTKAATDAATGALTAGASKLASPDLVAVSQAINGWEKLAMGYISVATGGLVTADNVAVSSAFTTVDPETVLTFMANPNVWVDGAAGAGTYAGSAALQALLTTVKPTPRAYELIQNAGGATIHQIPAVSLNEDLTPKVLVSQGALTLPQYTNALATDPSGHWVANTTLGGALDPTGATPPADADGNKNVTHRYPIAEKQRDVVVPVMMFEPMEVAKATGIAASDADNDATYYNSGCVKPGAGWPVVIMQHGFTSERTGNLINGTNIALLTCSAVIAMDLPHHGIAADSTRLGLSVDYVNPTDETLSPFAAAKAAYIEAAGADNTILDDLAERHENLFLDSSTAQVTPMSFANATGGSGSLWIRLDNFQRTRDNMRQGVMDLLNLNATLSTIDLDGSGALNGNATAAADFDINNVSYVGHSLGAIVGTVFVAVNNDSNPNYGNTALPRIQKAILATPGGQVTKLVENSVGIGPSILAGLKGSNENLVPGMSLLESYMKVLQATIDSADPMNFIGKLSAAGDATTDVLIPGMYGDLASGKPSDLVVPISGEGVLVAADTYTLADGSTAQPESSRGPLIGLKPMLEILDADNVKDTPTKHQLFAKYNDGGHGTFSSAGTDTSATGFDSAAVFGEMLNQSVKFLGAGATLPSAVNPDVDVTVVTGDLLITGAP